MGIAADLQLPAGIDWQHRIERWERMQQRYLVRRSERFAVLVELIRATQPAVTRVLDLGYWRCGCDAIYGGIYDNTV